MTRLTIHESWSGSPMKMEKRFSWKLIIGTDTYIGKICSGKLYDSPEDAIAGFHVTRDEDPILKAIQIEE